MSEPTGSDETPAFEPGGSRHTNHDPRSHGMGAFVRRIPYYTKLVRRFWRESKHPRDFIRLMRVRLAQSRGIGRLVCPTPHTTTAHVASLGGAVTLRTHTTDISVLAELIVSDTYKPLLRHPPRDACTILDLGAYTGLTCRWMMHAWPQARVIAVEPEAGNFSLLERNLAGFESRAHLVRAAAGGAARQAAMMTTAGEHGFTMVDVAMDDTNTEIVAVRTLTSILEEATFDGPIDVLKCDIEGAEQEVFANCAPWIRRVRLLVVECHNGFTVPELVTLLADNGAEFQIRDREFNHEYGHEVGVLTQH